MTDVRENYYRVGSSLWREFRTDDTRLMAAYVLTCDHRTTEGLFHLPLGYVSADLGWKESRTRKAFSMIADQGLIRYDDDARVCLIMKALKWQAPANPNQRTAALRKLVSLPETFLFPEFYQQARLFAEQFAELLVERFPQRFGHQLPITARTVEGIVA